MPRGSRLVGMLWRWHRRLGLAAALLALMLAVTGIMLNHSSGLGLDRRFVDWSWLSGLYGDHSAELPAFQLGSHWLSRAANGHVYLDGREVAPCRGELAGAVQADDLLLAGCAEELLLMTDSGELVETVTASTGLPVPVTGLGRIEGHIALQTGEGWRLVQLEQMDFSEPAPAGSFILQLAPGPLPAGIRAAMPAPERWLSWERVILDLHSGRLAGRTGVLLVDAAGVLLACLATSGVAMWWLHRRRRPRR